MRRFTNICAFDLVQQSQTANSFQESRCGWLDLKFDFLTLAPSLTFNDSFQGFTGTLCDKKASSCSLSPCLNGAVCVDDPVQMTGYRCFCKPVSRPKFLVRNFRKEEFKSKNDII